MAFYKLYRIHRRTDAEQWMKEFDEWLRPEYHMKRHKEARTALAQFMAAGALISKYSNMDVASMYP